MGCCKVSGQLNDILASVWYVGCCMRFVLFMLRFLLKVMWALVWYVGFCMICRLMNDMRADVWYVDNCILNGLFLLLSLLYEM